MDIELIATIAEAGMSFIALVTSLVALKKGKVKTAKTAAEIASEVNADAQKKFEKLCKKNNIELTNETVTTVTNIEE